MDRSPLPEATVFQFPFRHWWFDWFERPACGHRSGKPTGRVEISLHPRKFMVWFQCDQCAQYSLLRSPLLIPGLTFLSYFVVSYRILYNVSVGSSLLEAVLLFGALAAASYLVSILIGRITNRYTAIESY